MLEWSGNISENREEHLDTREKLRGFIIENFLFGKEDANLDDSESFLESGIIDSTGILEVVGFVEDEFDFEVRDEELVPDNFDSVDRLVAYIDRKTGSTA